MSYARRRLLLLAIVIAGAGAGAFVSWSAAQPIEAPSKLSARSSPQGIDQIEQVQLEMAAAWYRANGYGYGYPNAHQDPWQAVWNYHWGR